MKQILCCVAFGLLVLSAQALEFSYILEPKETECFGEMLSEQTLLISGATAPHKDVVLRFYDPEGTQIFVKANQEDPQISYTAESSGVYTVCYENNAEEKTELYIRIRSGIEAKDFSEIARSHNFKPIELDVYKIEELVANIRRDTHAMIRGEAKRMRKRDKAMTKMLIFAGITVIVLTILAFVQSMYLKRFFKSKKLL
jgi:hypothetical protein